MCFAERRVLVIPPLLAYGEGGSGKKVPGGATLEFDFEVVGIDGVEGAEHNNKPPRRSNVFQEMDRDGDGHILYEEMEQWFANMHPDKLPAIPHGVWERDDKNMVSHISYLIQSNLI